MNHLAPAWGKVLKGTPLTETPEVIDRGWLTPGDLIDGDVSRIHREGKGVRRTAGRRVGRAPSSEARPHLTDAQYQDLHHYFARTLLTARLHQAVSTAYFGFRVYARGETFRTPAVMTSVRAAL